MSAIISIARQTYYSDFHLQWLEHEINIGLHEVGGRAYRMDFRFESMNWPIGGDVVSALASRWRVYQTPRAGAASGS
jgi:hypothetical protein